MRVIVQDNLWFRGEPHFDHYQLDGRTMIPVEPLLGLTDSSDPKAKLQELQWLLRYTGRTGSGLIVAQNWIQPGDLIDRNLAAWIELFEQHAGRAHWCISYDPVLATCERGLLEEPPVDFSRREILDLWHSDIEHLEKRYFDSSHYWRRGGQPVLHVKSLYNLRSFDTAFSKTDASGIYLLGDVLGSRVDPESLSGVSGVTGFSSALPGQPSRKWNYNEFLGVWANELADWIRRAIQRNLEFFPAASLQYDNTLLQEALGSEVQPPTRIAAHSRINLELLLGHLRSAARGTSAMFLGSANNWAEGTSCLPTVESGPRYPSGCIGNYHFDHLEEIQKVLFPEVRPYDGPTVRRRRLEGRPALEVGDADFAGKVRLRGNCDLTIGRNCRRYVLGAPEEITIRNLDGKKTRWRLDEQKADTISTSDRNLRISGAD